MNARGGTIATALVVVFLSCWIPEAAQTGGNLYVRPQGELYFPLDSFQGAPLFSAVAFGGGTSFDFSLSPWLTPFVRGLYLYAPYAGGSSALQATEGDIGLGLTLRPTDRLSLRLDGMGGLAELFYSQGSGTAYSAGARLGLEYRLSPAASLSASSGYSTYLGGDGIPILAALEAGFYFSFDLSALGGIKPRLAVEAVKLDAVFPSLYGYYDDNAFGTVTIANREDAAIRDVKVSFNAGRYMDQPKVCGQYDRIAKGASVTVPVTALFTDTVLNITQNIDAKGEIIVEYSYLGSDRVVRAPIDFQMHHRNAITWSDDRRAAAFVSPTNPAAMWFSKFAAGIVRDRLRGDVNRPLQYAIGMFEAERLYGLNYVVVPANDYSVKHGLKDYIDSVQFPHQTLINRGGDCSDLAILFATLMQSVGVEAAFITIPGHIFAAFDTGLSEAQARSAFYDSGLIVFRDGKAWIPVEITMVNDGFIKAWRVAAKEWADNSRSGAAAFYPLPECWKVYPSAAFPDVNPRFSLPDEAETAQAFDGALDRFVAREIEPQVQSLEAELANEAGPVRANELGILFANYGMLKESWKSLSDSAKGGYQKAWTNLGNVAYLRKDFKLALSYYQWAYQLDGTDDYALLGIARCQYELENFDASDSAYADLRARDPALAGKYGYLGSIFGGEGRAWSLAERFASTSWATSRVAAAPVKPPTTAASPPPAAAGPSEAAPPAVAAAPLSPAAPAPAAATPPAVAAAPLSPAAPAPAAAGPSEAAPPAVAAAPLSPAAPAPAAAGPSEAAPPAVSAAPLSPAAPAPAATAPSEATPPAVAAAPLPPAAPAPAATAPPAVAAASPTEPKITAPVPAPTKAPASGSASALPAPTSAPEISAVLPTDAELAQKAADSAAAREAIAADQKAAVQTAAKPAAALPAAGPASTQPAPTSAPEISAVLPTDAELAQKAADSAAAREAIAADQKAAVQTAAKPAAALPAAGPVSTQSASGMTAVAGKVPSAKPPSADKAADAAAQKEQAAVAVAPARQAATSRESAPEPAASVPAPPTVRAVEMPEAAVMSPNALGRELLIDGFQSTIPLVGTWTIANGVASQTDHDAFFAKLATPLVQDKRIFSYSFTAKSDARGRGWVGLGLHVFTPKSYTLKGYGSGDSICVWLTRDPVHLDKDITRLQIYRSTDDWNMDLLTEVAVGESIYDPNRFEITVDAASRSISVSMNGTERLSVKDVLNLRDGVYVVFRTLDTAEFSDFKAEAGKNE